MFPPETKILLAEDMSSIREVIIEVFNSIGFKNIISCKDGADAWETIQNESPPFKLIVSDLNMPASNGMDLLIRIRASDRFKNLPFLMLSEVSVHESIVAALKAGADHYLVKPVEAPDLAIKLKHIYDKKHGVLSK